MEAIRVTWDGEAYRVNRPNWAGGEVVELTVLNRAKDALEKLVQDSTASDFNEHWESYKEANQVLKEMA